MKLNKIYYTEMCECDSCTAFSLLGEDAYDPQPIVKSSKKQIDQIKKVICECFDVVDENGNREKWKHKPFTPNHMIVDNVGNLETDGTPLVTVELINSGCYDSPLEIYLKNSKGKLMLFEFIVGDYLQIPSHYFKMSVKEIEKELKKCIIMHTFTK